MIADIRRFGLLASFLALTMTGLIMDQGSSSSSSYPKKLLTPTDYSVLGNFVPFCCARIEMILIHPSVHLFITYALLSIGAAHIPPTPIFRPSAVVVILAYAVFGLIYLDSSRGSAMWVAFCDQ